VALRVLDHGNHLSSARWYRPPLQYFEYIWMGESRENSR